MKRFVLLLLCILLLAALATPAFAAGTTSFSMSASGSDLHRGDTVTFTVSVSSSEPATSYGFMLSYDSSVFELVNGSCTVGGTLVSSFNNGFAFMFQTATAYSDIVGTVTFKVKDNAPFGNFTVSGSASVKNGSTSVDAFGASSTVAVSCAHSYGSWTKVNDSQHKRTCSVCQKEETVDHSWDNGTVIKEPSCKETGVKTFTCTGCNASKTEDIAKTTDHKYGNWTKANDAQHKRICSVCQKEEAANHSWDSGKVTKQANCKETGVKTLTCTGCNATMAEDIPKTNTHSYGGWSKVNDTTHKHSCSVCQKEETANHSWNSGSVTKQATCKEEGIKTFTCTGCNAVKTEKITKLTAHTYDHACDTDCNVCGSTRTTMHNYNASWSKEKNGHWHECSVCKEKKDMAAHTPGAEATETEAQTCTECGYVIKAALGHTHQYATAWTTDENGHWYACSGCEEKGSYAVHDFENDCDKDCSICGYTRETAHKFDGRWTTDAEKHWHECTGCGLKQDEAAHEPGAEATVSAAQTCTICNYEIAPALGEPESTTDVTEPRATGAEKPVANDGGEFYWWIVIAAVVAGSAGAVVIIKKKKS